MEKSRREIIADLKKIPDVGESTAKKLIDEFSVSSLEDITKLKIEELAGIQGLGMKKAEYIIEYVASINSADKVKCGNCEKEISRSEAISGIRDNHFCSSECSDRWGVKKEEKVFLDSDDEENVCDHCGKEVDEPDIVSDGVVFCSKECFERWKFLEERVEVSCDYCSREFTRLKTIAEMREHHFCSFRCKDMWETRNDILLLNCEYCDGEFSRKKELVDRSEHQFCSYTCKERWPHRDTLETIPCEYCGEEFTRKRILVDRSEHDFCSYTCKESREEELINLICEHCGKNFRRKRKFSERYDIQYCSYNCMNNCEKQ